MSNLDSSGKSRGIERIGMTLLEGMGMKPLIDLPRCTGLARGQSARKGVARKPERGAIRLRGTKSKREM